MNILSLDPGATGGIALLKNGTLSEHKPMPMKSIVIQEKLLQFALDNKGKKQFIKSGPNKGNAKMKVRRPEISEMKLDLGSIEYSMSYNVNTIVIERQHPRPGGSSGSCAKTMTNYGRLLCLAELSNKNIIIVEPSVWKKHFNITLTKEQRKTMTPAQRTRILKELSIAKAEHISGKSFKTARGALIDGNAEAFLIGLWYHQTKE